MALTTDASGALVDSRMYDAYRYEFARGPSGAFLSVPQSDEYGFNARWGYVYNWELGTYYCQNPTYDPAKGRWLKRDLVT